MFVRTWRQTSRADRRSHCSPTCGFHIEKHMKIFEESGRYHKVEQRFQIGHDYQNHFYHRWWTGYRQNGAHFQNRCRVLYPVCLNPKHPGQATNPGNVGSAAFQYCHQCSRTHEVLGICGNLGSQHYRHGMCLSLVSAKCITSCIPELGPCPFLILWICSLSLQSPLPQKELDELKV